MEQREVEIDLIDFVSYVLSHWRSMLACVLIGAVLGCGIGVLKAKPTPIVQKSMTELAEELTTGEKTDVQTVILYDDLIRQYETSALMQLDANAVAEGTLIFSIKGVERNNSKPVYQAIYQLLTSTEFYQYVANQENYDGDISQLFVKNVAVDANSDLQDAANTIANFAADSSHSFIYTITVCGENEDFCNGVLSDINAFLDSKMADISDMYGSYRIDVISSTVGVISDAAVLDLQMQQTTNYATVKKSRDTLAAAFTGSQNEYYQMLIGNESETPAVTESRASRINLKWIVVGVFLLFVLWGFYFLMRYVFTGKWQAYHTYSGCYGITDIALIRRAEDKKQNGLDRAIARGRLRGGRVLPMQDAIEAAASTIALRAQKDELHRVALVGCTDGVEDIFRQLADGIQKKNASVEVRILHDLPYTASAIDQLQDTDGVVVVETAGVTNRTEMTKELTLLADQKMNILGGITIA